MCNFWGLEPGGGGGICPAAGPHTSSWVAPTTGGPKAELPPQRHTTLTPIGDAQGLGRKKHGTLCVHFNKFIHPAIAGARVGLGDRLAEGNGSDGEINLNLNNKIFFQAIIQFPTRTLS